MITQEEIRAWEDFQSLLENFLALIASEMDDKMREEARYIRQLKVKLADELMGNPPIPTSHLFVEIQSALVLMKLILKQVQKDEPK